MSMYDDAIAAAKYLRQEADFNRSWADGRRGNVTDLAYKTQRLKIAAQRDRWATAIEDTVKLARARIP